MLEDFLVVAKAARYVQLKQLGDQTIARLQDCFTALSAKDPFNMLLKCRITNQLGMEFLRQGEFDSWAQVCTPFVEEEMRDGREWCQALQSL